MTSIIEKAVEKALGERVWVVEVVYRAVRITLHNVVKLEMVENGYLVVTPRIEGKYDEEESRIINKISNLTDEVISLENLLNSIILTNQRYVNIMKEEN